MKNSARIGCVSYLNAKPLIHCLHPGSLDLAVPSELARRFASGRHHAALLPLFDILSHPPSVVVDQVSISCEGPVASVIVASPRPLSECDRIARDPSSLTSNALLQVILREFLHSETPVAELDAPDQARLLIGDPALAFRKSHPEWHILDLGGAWHRFTGLPFVFAAWKLSDDAPPDLPATLRKAKLEGLESLPQIANGDPAALAYLTENLRYNLGPSEKSAIHLFTQLCLKHQLLTTPPTLLWK